MHIVAMSSFWRELVIQLNKYIKGYEEEEKNPTTQKAVKKKKLKSVKNPWKSSVIAYPRFYGGKKAWLLWASTVYSCCNENSNFVL